MAAKDTSKHLGLTILDDDGTEDYDPHKFRVVQNPTSNFETFTHILKGALGTGILAMPEGFMNAGKINGLFCTILIGALCTYCLHMLIKTQYHMCKKLRVPILSYPEAMQICLETGPGCLRIFAKSAYYIVDFFLVFYQVGICCIYVVFIGINVKAVMDEHLAEQIRVEYYILMTFVPILLIAYIKNLKLLAPFSSFANVITLIPTVIVIYYLLKDSPMPNIDDRSNFGTFYTFPMYFGTTLCALESVGVIIAVENNMKNPKAFGGWFGVFNIGMATIISLYVFMGFFGYWKYGDRTEPSITLNLPVQDWLPQVVNILYALGIYFTYSLQCYVAIWILWETYIYKHVKDNDHYIIYEYLLRTAFVIVTYILAATIPYLGLFISLFGALCLSALGIVFPCLMDICTKWPDKLGPYKWILYRNTILIIIGLFGLISGSYSSISEIVSSINNDASKKNVLTRLLLNKA